MLNTGFQIESVTIATTFDPFIRLCVNRRDQTTQIHPNFWRDFVVAGLVVWHNRITAVWRLGRPKTP